MKKLLVLLLVIGCCLLAAYLFVRFKLQADIGNADAKWSEQSSHPGTPLKNQGSTLDLRPLFVTRLQQLIRQGSKELYNLSLDSMDVDVLRSTVRLYNVHLAHDKKALKRLDSLRQAPDDVFNVHLKELTIDGINIDDFVHRKTIDLNSVLLKGPTIEIYHQRRFYNKTENKKKENLYQRIRDNFDKIAIGKLLVEEGTAISYDVKQKNKKSRFNDVVLSFHDILIDSTTQFAKDRFLFSKKGFLSLRNYAVKTADNLYLFKVDLLTIEAPRHVMTLNGISLHSKYRQLKTQKELYDLSIPRIQVEDIDWWRVMNKEDFIASKMKIENPKFHIFLDRSLPSSGSAPASFPNQMIMNLPMQVYIKNIQVQNLDLSYKEYNPATARSGTLNFDRANIKVSNLTNMPEYIRKNKNIVVSGSARFMHKAPFLTKISFDMAKPKNGLFAVDVKIGGFNGEVVNSLAVPLGLFKIEKGRLDSAKVHITGDRQQSTGKVLIIYKDLKLSLYKKDHGEKSLDKKGVMGFLANTFVIKDDNPKNNNAPRESVLTSPTNPSASFCNHVWKTTLMGILETIGVNPQMATK